MGKYHITEIGSTVFEKSEWPEKIFFQYLHVSIPPENKKKHLNGGYAMVCQKSSDNW
jgi:hypothetical protein